MHINLYEYFEFFLIYTKFFKKVYKQTCDFQALLRHALLYRQIFDPVESPQQSLRLT